MIELNKTNSPPHSCLFSLFPFYSVHASVPHIRFSQFTTSSGIMTGQHFRALRLGFESAQVKVEELFRVWAFRFGDYDCVP